MPVTKQKWQFDGVVRLTRIGTAFVIFTVVIGFAAINTGNNSLYIGLSLMLGCLLLSGIASKDGLKHLVVEFDGVDEAWAMRPAHGRLRIRNRSRIWNVRDVIVTSEELAAPLCIPLIKRGDEIVAHAMFSFRRRGLTQLTRVDLYTRYPFGFFLKKRRPRLAGDVVVFPRLLGDDIPRDRFRPIEGDLQSVESHRRRHGHPLLPRLRPRRFAPPRALEKVRIPRPLDHQADRGRDRPVGAHRRRSVPAART